jgi:hypothetical protein
MIKKFLEKWNDFVNRMNKYGIPVPTVRDPRTGKGSITAALVVASAGLFGFCIIFMLATTVAKWAGLFAMTDLSIAQVKTAADYSFQFLLAALGGYLGRHLQKGESIDEPAAPAPKPAVKSLPKVDDPDQQ